MHGLAGRIDWLESRYVEKRSLRLGGNGEERLPDADRGSWGKLDRDQPQLSSPGVDRAVIGFPVLYCCSSSLAAIGTIGRKETWRPESNRSER